MIMQTVRENTEKYSKFCNTQELSFGFLCKQMKPKHKIEPSIQV